MELSLKKVYYFVHSVSNILYKLEALPEDSRRASSSSILRRSASHELPPLKALQSVAKRWNIRDVVLEKSQKLDQERDLWKNIKFFEKNLLGSLFLVFLNQKHIMSLISQASFCLFQLFLQVSKEKKIPSIWHACSDWSCIRRWKKLHRWLVALMK
jgi:hypothetical protein